MSKRIRRAIAAYQASITPEAIKETIKLYRAKGGSKHLLNAQGLRMGYLLQLQGAIEAEIAQ